MYVHILRYLFRRDNSSQMKNIASGNYRSEARKRCWPLPRWSPVRVQVQVREREGMGALYSCFAFVVVFRRWCSSWFYRFPLLLVFCFLCGDDPGDNRIRSGRFRYVVIDECTQATAPETVIPLTVKGVQQVRRFDYTCMGTCKGYVPTH